MLGRNFRAGEDTPSGEKVAILAYSTWRERYNGDANIIGKHIRVNGVPYSVVGVMPEGFAFPNNDKIWVPLQTRPARDETRTRSLPAGHRQAQAGRLDRPGKRRCRDDRETTGQ